jgi:hypothetical protein
MCIPGNQKGTIVGICGGTSIPLFYDLAHYLMRMNADKVGKLQGKQYKIFKDETFEDLSDPSFQFILFTSFRTNSVPLQARFKALDKWGKDFKFTNFAYYERVSEQVEDRWDASYFNGKLPSNVAKVLITGAKAYVLSVKAALIQHGLPEDIIFEL